MPRPTILAALAAAALAPAAPAAALDKVSFGTDWRAQAEHGGFYQAIAAGIYAKHGLDVTIRQGGPQVNQRQLLVAGGLDFNMGSNGFGALNFVQENIPFLVVASIFQKDPAVLIAHPGQGNDTLAALKGKPIMIWHRRARDLVAVPQAQFGYTDDQIRPYTFNMAPFLADKGAIQQGYLSSASPTRSRRRRGSSRW